MSLWKISGLKRYIVWLPPLRSRIFGKVSNPVLQVLTALKTQMEAADDSNREAEVPQRAKSFRLSIQLYHSHLFHISG